MTRNHRERHGTAPLAPDEAIKGPRGHAVAWIVATPAGHGSEKWAFDTEVEAETFAGELVKSKRAEFAVTYRTTVEIEGAA